MNRLENAVSSRNPGRFHFVIGPGVQDIFVKDGVITPFLPSFNHVLLHNGFTRSIHISPTTVVQCIDERSQAACSHVIWPQREEILRTGIIMNLEAGPLDLAVPQKPVNEIKTNGISDVHGIRMVDVLMSEPSAHRTAFVVYDAVTFATHFQSPRILFGLFSRWFQLEDTNQNECFLIVPVIKTQDLMNLVEGHEISQFLTSSSDRQKFSNIITIPTPSQADLVSLVEWKTGQTYESSGDMTRLMRICAAENQPLRVWKERFEESETFNLSHFREKLWIQSVNDDVRSIDEKLDHIVGLNNVKNYIKKIRLFADYASKSRNHDESRSFHMVFYGNPGTGKTTIARLFGQIFQESGLLRKGHLTEVKGSDLIAEYVGGTGIKTDEVIQQALDGVLFIDEAYSLSGEDRGGFGKEALEVLIKRMEDDRKRLVVILAGYKDEMNHFFKINPGLSRRFPESNRIEFDDLSNAELEFLLYEELEQRGLTVNQDLNPILREILLDLRKRKGAHFGNAGEVRNIVEGIELSVKARTVQEGRVDYRVTLDDIPPQYKNVIDGDEKDIDDILAPLNNLLGMDHIREHLLSIARLKKIDLIHSSGRPLSRKRYLEHYLFLGNPGTGKTTTARILGQILNAMGVLKTNHVVEVTAADLIAGYVGQTPEKTRRVVENALDGILFIDEAYTLYPGPIHNQTGYGREVIDTLVKMIEEYKENLVVVMAGYPDDMVRLIRSNPGLNSRFTRVIHFPDLTGTQLGEILANICLEEGYILTEEVKSLAINYLLQVKELTHKSFGNAREVQKLFRHMSQNLANRVVGNPLKLTSSNDLPVQWNQFLPEDVSAYDVIIDSNNLKDSSAVYGVPTRTGRRRMRKL